MIFGHVNLFFYASITDNRMEARGAEVAWRHGIYSPWCNLIFTILEEPNSWERLGDDCLSHSRYWWNGKKIELSDEYVSVTEEEEENLSNLIDKIKSIAIALLLLIPGILIKSLAWLNHPFEIYQRNQLIWERWNEQQDFIQQYDDHLHEIKPREFDALEEDQPQSALSTLPKEMITHISSFLEDKDRGRLALTCQQNYHLMADFYQDVLDISEIYPDFITQSIEKDVLRNLPHGSLPGGLLSVVEKADICHHFSSTQMDVQDAGILIAYLSHSQGTGSTFYLKDLFKFMGDNPIQTIQTSEGRGMVIRLKNNLPEKRVLNLGNQAIIITKIKGQWRALCLNTSGAMWLFLNDIHFSPNAPEVIDYLRRLFKGEPCGNFSDHLNATIQIDYEVARAGNILNEGPRTCPDGITSVVQLWEA